MDTKPLLQKSSKRRYLLGLALAVLTGCASSDNSEQSPQVQKDAPDTWHLVNMDGTKASDKKLYQHYTLRIGKQRLSGKASNYFNVGAVFHQDGRLQVQNNMAVTLMMPIGRDSFLEPLYLEKLSLAKRWQKSGSRLTLSGDKGTLVFEQ